MIYKPSKKTLLLHVNDNIVVALKHLFCNNTVEVNGINVVLLDDIQEKHKFALVNLKKGDKIIMYGIMIGSAIRNIKQGEAITISNIEHVSSEFKRKKKSEPKWVPPDVSKYKQQTFNGYMRQDGKAGTKNYWLVIPLTFCENTNIDVLEEALSSALGYINKKDYVINIQPLVDEYSSGATIDIINNTKIISTKEEESAQRLFPNVDGIKYLKHNGGCGGTREDAQTLCNLIAGYIMNPNVAGATILSLGCQNAQISLLQKTISNMSPNFSKPISYIEHQEIGSEKKFIEKSIKSIFIGLIKANKIKREPVLLGKLILGLECGGSDGFSGISANPALGYVSDILVALGGSSILSEFPELNGVEQEIINRCTTNKDALKFSELMRIYSDTAIATGSSFENNPSPGNIKDGLITDAMKSAGAAKKGGTSPIVDILDYTEQIKNSGLNLLCTPGNDVESITGMVGSGCNIVIFTTGLGSPTGNPITPVLKLSSNTKLYNKMNDIIDLDAGTIINGEETIENVGDKIMDYIIKVASGNIECKADLNDKDDFIPWKRGVSL